MVASTWLGDHEGRPSPCLYGWNARDGALAPAESSTVKQMLIILLDCSLIIKYRDLYSSMPFNGEEMQTIIDQVNISLPDVSLTADCFCISLDLQLTVSGQKLRKSEASSGLSRDHFVYAGDDCFAHISLLLTSIIAQGRVPI